MSYCLRIASKLNQSITFIYQQHTIYLVCRQIRLFQLFLFDTFLYKNIFFIYNEYYNYVILTSFRFYFFQFNEIACFSVTIELKILGMRLCIYSNP